MKSRYGVQIFALGVWALVATLAREAHAQTESGIQLAPDSQQYLINKFVPPNEQWAISFNLAARTATGNVFKTDGSPPSFIWCELVEEIPAANPVDTQYFFDCFGSGACAAAPCSTDAWVPIGTRIPISGDFLLPDQTSATFRGRIQPIFTARCALPTCHTGPTPAQSLNLDEGQAYQNIVLRISTQEADHFLVEPFDPSSSHLYNKILGIEEEGEQMPLGGPPLTAEETQAIQAWILEGAANN